MIIVDSALQERQREGRPVRVGMVGAGFMGRGVAAQISRTPGMELVAVSNRHLSGAERAYRDAGAAEVRAVDSAGALDQAASDGVPAVTEDASLLCAASSVDVVCDVTGAVEFGARVTLDAFDHGKHVVTMNAELDGTVGPLLKVLADQAGVIFSGVDGDQPGVQLNLHRFVRGMGITPLVCGNIKGLQDEHRNPTTQEGFARQWGQDPYMVTSFADGTKVSFEQAIVANATGMTVAQRGMGGAEHTGHVDELTSAYDVDELLKLGGVVDYVVGAKPGPGVFVLGHRGRSLLAPLPQPVQAGERAAVQLLQPVPPVPLRGAGLAGSSRHLRRRCDRRRRRADRRGGRHGEDRPRQRDTCSTAWAATTPTVSQRLPP
jgi:predicted homoserine dehydrogenase-like protein